MLCFNGNRGGGENRQGDLVTARVPVESHRLVGKESVIWAEVGGRGESRSRTTKGKGCQGRMDTSARHAAALWGKTRQA